MALDRDVTDAKRKRAFRAAARHSRGVRVLRVVLPLIAVLAVAGAGLVAWLNPLRMLTGLPIKAGPLIVSGSKVTMQAPRLSGYTQDRRPYNLTAESAAHDLTRPGVIEMERITADVEMEGSGTMKLGARRGIYNSQAGTVSLDEDVVLESVGEYQVRMLDAQVNLGAGSVTTAKRTHVVFKGGEVTGNRLEVTGSGDLIRFDDGVTMIVQPQADVRPPTRPTR